MSVSKRTIAAVVGVIAVLAAAISFATSANAAPYSNQPTTGVSNTTPSVGGTDTVSGSGYDPNELVDLVLHSAPYNLGTARADSAGNFSTTVTLPAGVSGSHTIIATGETSGVSVVGPAVHRRQLLDRRGNR